MRAKRIAEFAEPLGLHSRLRYRGPNKHWRDAIAVALVLLLLGVSLGLAALLQDDEAGARTEIDSAISIDRLDLQADSPGMQSSGEASAALWERCGAVLEASA